jgi:SAM-dependent methyltransferase
MDNADLRTVDGFGDEWSRFSQEELSAGELAEMFDAYFRIFPWDTLPKDARGIDFGCGSGRWAKLVAPRVGHLLLLDASDEALGVARRNLKGQENVSFVHASVTEAPVEDGSLDFAYSLGVLHHMPDTEAAIRAIGKKLKPGAPFLIYLYYAFDNRPAWFRTLWKSSDLVRMGVSRLPHGARYAVSQFLAATVYWPLARTALVLDKAGKLPSTFPLSYYRDRSFYVMRNDALDRLGTRLEQRFTKADISGMLYRAGFDTPTFSDGVPHWVAWARKK